MKINNQKQPSTREKYIECPNKNLTSQFWVIISQMQRQRGRFQIKRRHPDLLHAALSLQSSSSGSVEFSKQQSHYRLKIEVGLIKQYHKTNRRAQKTAETHQRKGLCPHQFQNSEKRERKQLKNGKLNSQSEMRQQHVQLCTLLSLIMCYVQDSQQLIEGDDYLEP